MKKVNYSRLKAFLPLIIVLLIDFALLLIGYKIDSFNILQYEIKEEQNSILYAISNSNLMIVMAICVINVLAIIQTVFNLSFISNLQEIDKGGEVHQELTKVERHLTDYDKHSIAFELLSEVESSIGVKEQKVHNEIWILTNNFEEAGTSEEAKQLRNAIISNLCTNVDYYYVIPKSKEEVIKELGGKLHQELGRKKPNGTFKYIIDDALEFIPTPYFDIDMYLVKGIDDEFIQDKSVIYYCFSRISESGDYFYRRVQKETNEIEIWKRMTEYTKHYKEEHSKPEMTQFKTLIP